MSIIQISELLLKNIDEEISLEISLALDFVVNGRRGLIEIILQCQPSSTMRVAPIEHHWWYDRRLSTYNPGSVGRTHVN